MLNKTQLPEVMRAVEIKNPGGPEMLVPVQVPLPKLREGEILIKNEAAGVNRPDIAQRTGHYPVPADANPLPGLEVAGEVIAVSDNAGKWEIGDKAMGLTHGGGYAEYTAVQHSHCLSWPKGFDSKMAAAIPENFYTVYYNVFMRSNLKSGDYFLVHGGSSGIGVAAIQLAKAALYAGVRLLMDKLNIQLIDRIILTGAFGSHIDGKYAMILGMIPDCDISKVSSAGNAAGTGARITLLNMDSRKEIETVVRGIKKIETAVEPMFQNHFVEAMSIPHKTASMENLKKVVKLPNPLAMGTKLSRKKRRTRKPDS